MTSFFTRDLWPFDLWPWPLGGYKLYPRHITCPSFIKILQREEGEKWLTNSLTHSLTTDQHNHSIGWAMPPKNKCVCVFKMCMCFRGDWVFMEYLPLENVYVFWKSVCGSRTVVSENKCVCVLEMCMWFGDDWVLYIFWGKKCVCFFKICMFFRGN